MWTRVDIVKTTPRINVALLTFFLLYLSVASGLGLVLSSPDSTDGLVSPQAPTLYTPKFEALNFEEEMTLTPIFTPDNALAAHKYWIDKANDTILVQNQYLTQFDRSVAWADDPSPIVRGLVDAHDRGVTIRVQVNEGGDSDDVTSYFQGLGISVRWMGNSASDSGDGYLSDTHNKLVIIDGEVTLVSSINFGENAFTNNREAGMIIHSSTAANYYTSIFESDWEDGEVPPTLLQISQKPEAESSVVAPTNVVEDYPSHTDIPLTNFTGSYNVTLFTNPDNADEVIFHYLESAQESVYVSMYTISRPDFNNTLINLKKANPGMDIQVLISNRRVGGSENVDTHGAAESLVANLIPVYNSTKDDDKVDGFYHNKYWIIDGKHVFVYSGNWSPRSVTPQLEEGSSSYSSGEANRDMGIAVHDATEIANHYKAVWDADVAVADAWELPVGIKQNAFDTADVVSGSVDIGAQVAGLEDAETSYRWNAGAWVDVALTAGVFSESFDTTTLSNGISTFEVRAVSGEQVFTDSVTVNVANYASTENWRVLITEVLPNPEVVSDTEGEFIELTNSFPFDVLLEGWQVGDNNILYTFTTGYTLQAYSSIIIARDPTGFETGYSKTADIELGFSLTNSEDYVQLLDAKGEYMDVVAYGMDAPDGSATLDAPGAGESLHRSPLHVDTNTSADFSLASPDPKGTVPEVALDTSLTGTEGTSSTGGGTDTSIEANVPLVAVLTALVAFPVLRRRLR